MRVAVVEVVLLAAVLFPLAFEVETTALVLVAVARLLFVAFTLLVLLKEDVPLALVIVLFLTLALETLLFVCIALPRLAALTSLAFLYPVLAFLLLNDWLGFCLAKSSLRAAGV